MIALDWIADAYILSIWVSTGFDVKLEAVVVFSPCKRTKLVSVY